MEVYVARRFRILRKLAQTPYSRLYVAEDVTSHKTVVLKLESRMSKYVQLPIECEFYKRVRNYIGIPHALYFGHESDYYALALEKFDFNLEELLTKCHRRFSLKTVLFLAEQMLNVVELMHKRNFLHRDLKPENFMVRDKTLYVIDFGTAKRYKDLTTGQHCQLVGGQEVVGTGRYSSIRTLRGYEQSRRDDLEALGYIFMYLLRGSLPWIGVTGRHTKDRNTKIAKMKSKLTPVLLCQGFPAEFTLYFESVMRLGFEEEPDYAQYRKMFRELGIKEGIPYDYDYDWEHVEDERPAMPKLIPYSQPITRLNTPRKKKRAHMLLEELPTPQRSVTRNGRNAQEKGLSVSIPEMPRLARTSVQSPVHATSDGF